MLQITYYKHNALLCIRQCESCQLVFANQNGLDKHVGKNKNNNCGRLAQLAKKKKEIAKLRLRKEAIFKFKMKKANAAQIHPQK